MLSHCGGPNQLLDHLYVVDCELLIILDTIEASFCLSTGIDDVLAEPDLDLIVFDDFAIQL